MKITATYRGERQEIPEWGHAELVAFERHFKCSAAVLQDKKRGRRMEHLCFLVFASLRKRGLLGPGAKFDDVFLDDLTEIEVDTTDEEGAKGGDAEDPTVPGRRRGPSRR